MARAMWKAVLRTGEEAVPVKMYAAVQDQRLTFHLLCAEHHARVVQHMVHPDTGEIVPSEDVHKGFAVEPGVFVKLSAGEIEALSPKPSREISIASCVPEGLIEPQWLDRPYYLGPDGQPARYAAFAHALSRARCHAIATWVLRGRSHAGVLHCMDGCLCLTTLHAREEIVEASLETPAPSRVADARELALAEQLVDTLHEELDLAQFSDQYRARVLELVETKARGGKAPKRAATRKQQTRGSELATQLRASVAHLRRPGLSKARRAPERKTRERKSA